MLISIIPKFLFESEDITTLENMGVKFDEGNTVIGKYKVPSYKFYNLDENQVFDKLESNALNEDLQTEKSNFANRMSALMFLKLRQAAQLKDPQVRVAATCGLLAAACAIGNMDPRIGQRFMSLIRSIN